MNTNKHWKPSAADTLSQEPDRPRHKFFTTTSHHKTSDVRTAGRDKEDVNHRSGRGYVSDGPPASTYLTGAQSFPTASKAPHNVSTQPSQGYPAYMSQKVPLTNPPQQETHTTAQRHWETAPDPPRTTSHRTVTATDKVPFMSTDPIRHAEDNRKSSRHRPRHPPTPAPENTEPQAASNWPRPSSFLKKVGTEVREREKGQSRDRSKDESKANPKAKDRPHTDRPQEQIIRDQRERDPRHEEERRHHREERRREKERRRDEELRYEERRHEQKIKDDYVGKSTRDHERRRETKDGYVPVAPQGKDPRLMRVTARDSDESDNSLMKHAGSVRRSRQHAKDQNMTPVVPTVLRQPTYPVTPPQVPTAQPESTPAPDLHEFRQMATLGQPLNATPSVSHEKSSTKLQRDSPPQNLTVPYPPGYAVSASDSEHVSRREHRPKFVESPKTIERPRTSGGHRGGTAHDAVSKPPVAQPTQPSFDKSLHKTEKSSKGRFSAWLSHRGPSNSHPKPTDAHITDRTSSQPTTRAVPLSFSRNDTPDAIPQVVSIKAGEGPGDYPREYEVTRTAPPAIAPVAVDTVARQPPPSVQVVQRPETYSKQPRDPPRTMAGAHPDPPGPVPNTRVFSPQPWIQPARWSTEPRPMSPAPHPSVVPSPVVFPSSLASPPAPVDTQRHSATPRPAPRAPSNYQESYADNREAPFHNSATNGRPLVPPTHPHAVPLSTTVNGHRASPRGASPMIHDVVASKHSRYSSVPTGYANAQPYHVASPPSRPIAPDLAAVFPIREDNIDAYHHPSQGERPQGMQPSKETPDHWDRHRHNQGNVGRMIVSSVPSSERTPRSTKTSPNLHPRLVNQGTPPKPPLQPIPDPGFPTPSLTNPDVPHAHHDSSRPGVYNMLNQNSNPLPYPATSIYLSSSPHVLVEHNSATNNLPVTNASLNNPSPKMKSGNPSPRSRTQVVPSQGPPPPVAVHVTTRTPSHETGSTTLLGQTPSSQGSVSMQPQTSSPAHTQAIAQRTTSHGGQQPVHISAFVSDSLSDRNTNATSQNQVSITHQASSRHRHSNSAPVVPVSSLAQPPPRALAPVSPTPIRLHPTMQSMGDPQLARIPVPRYPSSSASNRWQDRDVIPSPSQESELNTPSSLAISTKLPIISDEPLAPVMSTQSFQEPKKKGGFFQGLGLFRSKSSAQKRPPHEPRVADTHAQTMATTTKLTSSKSPTPLYYDSDSNVVTTSTKLKKPKNTSVTAVAPQPPQPPQAPKPAPTPSFAAATEEKFSSAPNAFPTFRIVSKRYRTMSGVSAEAVDGTNAGASTVLTSPANSTRSPTPKLLPPQRDPQQAIHAWRNKEEAETRQRGNARRRRPGVHFEGYEDHPQAERHKYNYVTRAREKVRG